MAAQKVARLQPGQYIVDSGQVLSVTTQRSACLSLYSPSRKLGGLWHAKFSQLHLFEEFYQAVSRVNSHFDKDLQAKIVGDDAELIEVLERRLEEAHVPLSGKACTPGIPHEVYFYTNEGRLRVSALEAPQVINENRPRRVMIVDDSKVIRDLLTRIFSSDPRLEVVGTAESPIEAEPLITKLKPDVLTLDIQMPGMDGVTFLKKLLPRRPMPVVMISSLSKEHGGHVLEALETGAVDYIQKPALEDLKDLSSLFCDKIYVASLVPIDQLRRRRVSKHRSSPVNNTKARIDPTRLIAIGASTGGTEALRDVLTSLPGHIPPIVIVQHIPPVFSKAFSDRMNNLCPFTVSEAEDGMLVEPDHVYIAPGGQQMFLRKRGERLAITITDDPPVNRHKPSVDVLFESVAELAGSRAIGAILTGMGSDGAKGLLRMKKAGALTLAQDEESCVVFGMPKEAIKLGAADKICTLSDVPKQLMQWATKRRSKVA